MTSATFGRDAAAVGAEALDDLAGELAGRAETRTRQVLRRGLAPIGVQAMEDRQREGGRLAGAGLGDADQVASGDEVRNGLRLDRRRDFMARVCKRLEDRLCEAEFVERIQEISLS